MEICEALRLTRNKSGLSQEYMSFEFSVSRRTIQNWEMGVSEPSVSQFINWFKLTGQNPIPYLLQYTFPNINNLKSTDDLTRIKESLITLISSLPEDGIRELTYLLYGDHGSSPRGVLNLITAHLQTPLDDRVTQAGVIINNYEIAESKGNITRPDHIRPDMDFLKDAYEKAKKAVIDGESEYVI